MYWVEVRAGLRRNGPPRLVPLDEVGKHQGFRSVFAYEGEVAEYIRESKSTSGLRGLPVYADTLFVDFDNGPADVLIALLQDRGIGYQLWHSGGRSQHLHIPIEPISGVWVPSALKRWMKKNAPGADLSFYHPAGMYRLPGTYHAKNVGQRKHLLDQRSGDKLVIHEPPTPQLHVPTATDSDFNVADLYAHSLISAAPGERQPRAWFLATKAFELGWDMEQVLEHLRWWNDTQCDPPHSDSVLVRQAQSALQQLHYRTPRR
jgi:hypothetical protein